MVADTVVRPNPVDEHARQVLSRHLGQAGRPRELLQGDIVQTDAIRPSRARWSPARHPRPDRCLRAARGIEVGGIRQAMGEMA